MVKPEQRRPQRTVLLPLASFTVRVPIRGLIDHEHVFILREAIREVFAEAPLELLERRTLFDRPLAARTIVTNIRAGSIDLDTIFQVVTSIPWSEIAEDTEYVLERGFHYLKEIGSVAGGLVALKSAGGWLRQRLSKHRGELPLDEEEVSIEHRSTLEIEDTPEMSEARRRELRELILHEDRPVSVGTVLIDIELPHQLLRPSTGAESERSIGGANLIRDLNLFVNGVSSPEEFRRGDLVFYNNFAALGLRRNRHPETLYVSAASEASELHLRSVILTTYDAPDTERSVLGRRIDADSLEDA